MIQNKIIFNNKLQALKHRCFSAVSALCHVRNAPILVLKWAMTIQLQWDKKHTEYEYFDLK